MSQHPPYLGTAAEAARLFLASLEYRNLADERRACELRHRLRSPGPEVLRALRDVTAFLGGIHPAREGQAELMEALMRGLRGQETDFSVWRGDPFEVCGFAADLHQHFEYLQRMAVRSPDRKIDIPDGFVGAASAATGRSVTREQIQELAEYR